MIIHSATVRIHFPNDEVNQSIARALMTGQHKPYFRAAAIDEMYWIAFDEGIDTNDLVFDVTESWHVEGEESQEERS